MRILPLSSFGEHLQNSKNYGKLDFEGKKAYFRWQADSNFTISSGKREKIMFIL
jgi:hypothetical protein